MAKDQGYELLVSFPDQSASFVHGFEAGEIWAAMKARQEISRPVHDENVELIAQIGERNDYACGFTQTSVEGWVELKAVPRVPAGEG